MLFRTVTSFFLISCNGLSLRIIQRSLALALALSSSSSALLLYQYDVVTTTNANHLGLPRRRRGSTKAAVTIKPSSTATAATATFTGMHRCSSSSTSRRRSKNNGEDADDDDDDTANNSSATDRNHSWLIISSSKDNNNNHNNNNHNNTNNTNVPPEYRLAYRYVVATANNYNNNRTGDNNDSYEKAMTQRRQQQEQRVEQQTPVVLFCNGFRSVSVASSFSSSTEGGRNQGGGTKVQAVERYCTQHALDFCCFDYRGHGGLSSGKFDDMTLSDWIEDTQNILTHVVLPTTKAGKKTQQPRKVILVGASMGVWIALHIASFYNTNNSNHNKFNNDNDNENNNSSCNQPQKIIISGILGIAAAPDFIHDLWLQHYNHHTNKQQHHREEKGSLRDRKHAANDDDNDCIHIVSRYEESGYIIKFKLVKDAIKNWILLPSSRTAISNETITKHLAQATAGVVSKSLPIHSNIVNCCVHLLHGKDDQEISWKKSVELVDLLSTQHNNSNNNSNNTTVLELILDGDHQLSRPQDIQLILEALQSMI